MSNLEGFHFFSKHCSCYLIVECVLGSFGSVGGKWDVKDVISGTQCEDTVQEKKRRKNSF
jgi:hypothetical protein